MWINIKIPFTKNKYLIIRYWTSPGYMRERTIMIVERNKTNEWIFSGDSFIERK